MNLSELSSALTLTLSETFSHTHAPEGAVAAVLPGLGQQAVCLQSNKNNSSQSQCFVNDSNSNKRKRQSSLPHPVACPAPAAAAVVAVAAITVAATLCCTDNTKAIYLECQAQNGNTNKT